MEQDFNAIIQKNWKKITKSLLIIIGVIIVFSWCVSFNNKHVRNKKSFGQGKSERTVFYDKQWKIISQKAQVTLRNDSSFRTNVNNIMNGRKDAQGLFMKWVQESNPNANYDQVAMLYMDLSRSIEAQREEFVEKEKVMQDIKLQDDILISSFPNTILAWVFNAKPIEYIPIISDRTEQAVKTGKDNDVKIFE